MRFQSFRDPETGSPSLSVGDEIEATVVDDGKRSGSIVLKRSLAWRGARFPASVFETRGFFESGARGG